MSTLVFFSGYLFLTLLMIMVWAATIPSWKWFFVTVLNVDDPAANVRLALLLFPFYTFFMMGQLLTSVLYATGRTNYIALKSIVGNIVMAACFSLTQFGILPVNLNTISIIFGSGLILGFMSSSMIYGFLIRKSNKIL